MTQASVSLALNFCDIVCAWVQLILLVIFCVCVCVYQRVLGKLFWFLGWGGTSWDNKNCSDPFEWPTAVFKDGQPLTGCLVTGSWETWSLSPAESDLLSRDGILSVEEQQESLLTRGKCTRLYLITFQSFCLFCNRSVNFLQNWYLAVGCQNETRFNVIIL